MEELQRKYAEVLLKVCLKIEKKQPLLISANVERMDFVRIVAEIAMKEGVNDIYFDISDPYIKHEALKELSVKELKKLKLWDKTVWDEYAKKDAAFLMLASENPGLMKDIDPKKITEMTKYSLETRKYFDKRRDKSELAWTIAAVPTEDWANELFDHNRKSLDKLWDKIFDMCLIKEDDPQKLWKEKIKKLKERANKLNKCQFKKLKYSNVLGTNFEIELPENHIWCSGSTTLANGKEVLVNFPTEEVFTSPDCKSANGRVYSTKPLSYAGSLIEDFYIDFKDGKVINSKAKKSNEVLQSMINICENSEYLGEVALVQYDSPISNQKLVFLETLFDENASCHLALGDSFPECIKNGPKTKKDILYKKHNLNKCDSHVDFMIGSKDLKVVGYTKNNEEITIIDKGNFTKGFK